MEISFGSNDLSRSMSSRGGSGEDDEEELRWAAIERLPTYDRIRKSVLKHVLEDGTVKTSEINVKKLGIDERGHLISTILDAVEVDNDKFLQSLRARVDRVGIELPTVEIRYENLAVEGDVHVGGRALPTLINATLNSMEVFSYFITLSKFRIQLAFSHFPFSDVLFACTSI